MDNDRYYQLGSHDKLFNQIDELTDALANRDAEVTRLVEKCHDFMAQHETDSGIIESDGKEIYFLRNQRDGLNRLCEFNQLTMDELLSQRDQLREQVVMLREALQLMHYEKCDYMRLNHLGNPLEETSAKVVLKALAATEPKP